MEADLFKALADPTRRGVFERLSREGELSVGEITRGAGVSQPAVSQHLSALKLAGLVTEQKAGRNVRYRARAAGLAPLMDWMSLYGAFWDERFDRLEAMLRDTDT